jgi:hypothetical protein
MTLCGGQDFMNLQVVDKRALVTGASAGTDVAIAEVPPLQERPHPFFWTPARRIWIDKGAINTGA